MSLSYPFPTGLYRAIGEDAVTVVAHHDDGAPTLVCVSAATAFESAAALVLLENSPESFVVSHGKRFSPDGRVEVYDPARPWYAGELHQLFDVEWVTLGPQPWVYVFTHTEQEWVTARQAMKHLLQLGRLSPRSYLECDHAGFDQGLLAQDMDGKPHSPDMVARFRDATKAICVQNEEEGWRAAADLYTLLMRASKGRREQRTRARDEDDRWEEERFCEESTDEVEMPEGGADEDQREETIQEVSHWTSQRLLSGRVLRKAGNILKRLR